MTTTGYKYKPAAVKKSRDGVRLLGGVAVVDLQRPVRLPIDCRSLLLHWFGCT